MNCIIDECDKLAARRGLCVYHYGFAYKLIKAGKTSWSKLEYLGSAQVSPRRLKAKQTEQLIMRGSTMAQSRNSSLTAEPAVSPLAPDPLCITCHSNAGGTMKWDDGQWYCKIHWPPLQPKPRPTGTFQ
jgi:hypothetical protein